LDVVVTTQNARVSTRAFLFDCIAFDEKESTEGNEHLSSFPSTWHEEQLLFYSSLIFLLKPAKGKARFCDFVVVVIVVVYTL
jgi:hypothetical protein